MRKLSLFLLVGILTHRPLVVTAQQTPKLAYMQIFYEGSNWLAEHEVLHYSPAFRGRMGEAVQEDSTRAASPGALVFTSPPTATTQTNATSVSTEKGTFIRGSDGKMRLQTDADIRKEQIGYTARINRSLNLSDARTTLGRTALTNALNATAADGWEVVQMTSWGAQGGLVYLLRRR